MLYFISDYHLGQKDKVSKRSFKSIQHMHSEFINRWNSVVNKEDSVYILGDYCIEYRYLPLTKKLNGFKILVKGNHDSFKLHDYSKYFYNIHGAKYLIEDGIKFVITHIPVHPQMLSIGNYNIHGHTHFNDINDSRYINVSCEKLNYTPISLEKIIKNIRKDNNG